jgi:NADPH2:quinone reductase
VKAVVCTEYGSLDKLELLEVADPEPGEGQVVIDVASAGLNFPDLLTIRGLYQVPAEPPFVPGVEASGTVSGVGSDVSHLVVGQRVMAYGAIGAFAEKWAVDATTCVPIDDATSFDTAAALTVVYGTAYHALKQRAQLQPGEILLVLGAAGGVGSAAIEVGKAMGAHVIAAAGNDEKLAFCRELGADEAINYTDEDLKLRTKELTGGKGADIIFDPVGGDLTEQAFRSVAWKGRHLVIGFATGTIPSVPWNLPLLKGASIVGVFWGAFMVAEPDHHTQNMRDLMDMLQDGTLMPRVTASYALDDYKAAFSDNAMRRVKGKIVLHPSA